LNKELVAKVGREDPEPSGVFSLLFSMINCKRKEWEGGPCALGGCFLIAFLKTNFEETDVEGGSRALPLSKK